MIRNLNALEDFLGEEVVDSEGNHVGTLACYWERRKRNALLLGVDIPEKSGHTHIVPALGARCNERQSYVEVPFTRDKIAQAPHLPCECEMDETLEERVWAFYDMPAPRPADSEARSKQLRRVVQPDAPPADYTTPPVAGLTSGAEAQLLGLGGETPAARHSHLPGTDCPTEANETKTQGPPADGQH